jgi:oligoendopeptidase F
MTWDLSKLYASFDAPEYLNDIEELKKTAEAAVLQARNMKISVPALEEAIRLNEKAATLATKAMSFAQLTLAADANCESAMAAYARLLPVMNRLEDASYVRREPCPGDRRATNVVLTEEGWAKVVQAAPGHVRNVRRLVIDALEPEQVEQLSAISARLLTVLDPDQKMMASVLRPGRGQEPSA